jgi:hypothetical protein
MDTSAATVITSGSKVEIKSAIFDFTSDCTPNATSWTAITTAATAYIALTPSGTAGSQVVSASWLSAAPAWSDAAQGWYASAASSSRVIGGCYKGGSGLYERKFLMTYGATMAQPAKYILTSLTVIETSLISRVFEIGSWDMDATTTKNVGHNISSFTNIRSMKATIINDAASGLYDMCHNDGTNVDGGIQGVSSTQFALVRRVGGIFDSVSFNDAAINRGWVHVLYEKE